VSHIAKNLGVLLVERCVPDDDQMYVRILPSLRRKESTAKKPTTISRCIIPVVLQAIGEGVRYVKHNCLVSYFIMLTTTCFGHCGPSSGHKNIYRGKLYRV